MFSLFRRISMHPGTPEKITFEQAVANAKMTNIPPINRLNEQARTLNSRNSATISLEKDENMERLLLGFQNKENRYDYWRTAVIFYEESLMMYLLLTYDVPNNHPELKNQMIARIQKDKAFIPEIIQYCCEHLSPQAAWDYARSVMKVINKKPDYNIFLEAITTDNWAFFYGKIRQICQRVPRPPEPQRFALFKRG